MIAATSLFAGFFASSSGLISHIKLRNTNIKKGLMLGTGSIIAAFLGPIFFVNMSPALPKTIVGIVLIIVAVNMIIGDRLLRSKKISLNPGYLLVFGFVVGLIASVTGIGGGVFFVPVLFLFFNQDMNTAIGTSVMAVAITMLSGSVTYIALQPKEFISEFQWGYVYYIGGLILGIASILGAFLGAMTTNRISTSVLKKIFSLFLIIVVIRIFFYS